LGGGSPPTGGVLGAGARGGLGAAAPQGPFKVACELLEPEITTGMSK
jgi:hypothetical protein